MPSRKKRDTFWVADIEGKFEVPFSGLTVTDRKLKENPEEVKKVIRALVKAGRFFLTHHAESVALYDGLAQTL
jgi:ABC-type nitrate/sulfonate/bicarbonate transport system substrate-binding protein